MRNWRNFRSIDVDLQECQFLVGPAAPGKSNFLDAFGFLRDIAKPEGGGPQKADKDRGRVSKIHRLAARRDPEITIDVHLAVPANEPPVWGYALGIRQETRGYRQPYVIYERVWKQGRQILDNPTAEEQKHREQLTACRT